MTDRTHYITLTIGPEAEGERLDVFLARRFMRSRSVLHRRLQGQVLDSNGRPLKWSHRVRPLKTIRIGKRTVPEPPVQVTFRVLYQDEWILAVDKGPGAPVHPSRCWRERTILTQLRKAVSNFDLKPAHRLDRETSGVLVFGNTAIAVRNLMEQFRTGMVSKRYLAVVQGKPDFRQLRFKAPLARDTSFPIACRMQVDPKQGRPAVTNLEVVRHCNGRSLLAAAPETGRQHQIRVHLAHLGHPVLGDKLYQEHGKPYLDMLRDALKDADLKRLGHVRQALHAESISFVHPITQATMTIQAPLPNDLQMLLEEH